VETLNFTRRRQPRPKVPGTPNVVLIFLESFSAYKVGAMGNPLGATPNFDALASEGWLFTNFFVPSTGTARSIFTALFGIPDVETNSTSTRNPLVVDQHTIINSMQGYEKLYFIGGSASWGNLRGVLSNNVPGLRIYEEGDYQAPRTDVWGISDLKLFEEANEVLRAKSAEPSSKPFFAVIQSAGNHRPYTIPEDSGGYQWLEPEADDIKSVGFISVKEFNSFRFLDHSLGRFMALARKEPYFDNTVFFIFGDHGVAGYAKHLPSGMGRHQLTQHQVPFLIYAPRLLRGSRRITTIASELDVMPTVASVLGRPYQNTTLGRDLLEDTPGRKRYAFILIPYTNPPPIGLLDEEFYFLIDSAGRPKLYRYLSDDPTTNVMEQFPQRRARMEQLTLGLYETARYMLYNNRGGR
jgi:phosphoglycerol transferase MdoB-like AlkP superfamily enzyme